MRKHHRVLMIVITTLVIISFCWFWTKTDFQQMGADKVGRIYGRTVLRSEYQHDARLLQLASSLGMNTLLQDLTAGAGTENEAYDSFIWNRMVLRRETDELAIKPSSSEIADVVKNLRPFHGEAGFDLNKYNEFTEHQLAPMGFTEAQIEELAGDDLRLARLKRLLGVGVHISEAESAANYEQAYGKMDVSVIRFRAEDFEKEAKISDEDVAKYYEAHKEQLKSDEKRKVKFVSFALTDEQKKLTGKDRIEPLQKLADRSNEFTQAMIAKDADFDQVAAKFQVAPHETGEFTEAAPDTLLAATPIVARTAFQLTTADPNSDAIQSGDGFYVLRLTGVTPARPLTADEAQPKIVEALKRERVHSLLAAKASETAQKIREALKAGKGMADAVQQAGLPHESVPPFALAETPSFLADEKNKEPKNETPDLPQIKQAVAEMAPSEVSDFVPTEKGGLLVCFEKREPVDQAKSEQMKLFTNSQYLRGKREVVFQEWLRDRRKAAKIENARG